jgi:N-methylhydantoinase B
VPPRDAICLQLPGGGGFGDPRARDPKAVRDDVRDGLITAEQARRDYGVAIDAIGEIDLAETERLRASQKAAIT